MIMRMMLGIKECHIIFVAHRIYEKDETIQKMIGGPNVPGKLISDAPGMVDELYYLMMRPNKDLQRDTPMICTTGDGIFPAKSRLGRMGIFEKFEQPNLQVLIDKALKARREGKAI
jgi:hypothetical protein